MPELDSFAVQAITSLPPSMVAAVKAAPLPDLGDGPQVAEVAQLLKGGVEPIASQRESDGPSMTPLQRQLCTSGLWLLAGDLDRSHAISQDIGSAEGSFWHGIMHRREGDFGNSKYWFRRVGEHPVFAQLAELSGGSYADPYEFVDRCSRVKGSDDEPYRECQRAQWLEWQALMAYCISNDDAVK